MMLNTSIRTLLDLEKLPFLIGQRGIPSNAPFPDALDFHIGVNEELGMLIQTPDNSVAQILERVYQQGHQLGTAMQVDGLGRRYCDDFLNFVKQCLGENGLQDKRVLEIASGSGYLLNRLHSMGACVTGVEPGGTDNQYTDHPDITVLHNFFEACNFERKFDLVLHCNFLEHAVDFVSSLRTQFGILKPGGHILFSVPDCSDPMEHGDLSMFVHEHWTYFTKRSLQTLAAKLGARVCTCQQSKVGGVLFSCWQAGRVATEDAGTGDNLDEFVQKANRSLEVLTDFVRSARASEKTLGIYCPGRFLNYSHLLENDTRGVRFFDDDPDLTGRFLPPMAVPIECQSDLLARPVDSLLIMSRSFGTSIADSLRDRNKLASTQITLVEDLF